MFKLRRTPSIMLALLVAVGVGVAGPAPLATAQENGTIEQHPSWGFVGRLLIDGGSGGYCTVSLVRSDAVITAGHCVSGTQLDRLSVQLGGITTATFTATRKVVGFAEKGVAVDSLVVLFLDSPVDGVTPLRIAGSNEGSLWKAGTRPRSYGWGALSSNVPSSRELRYSELKVLDTTVSLSVYHGMLKAGRTGNGNPRNGDSGGPLIAFDASGQAVLIAVYSSGIPTGAHYLMKTGTNQEWLDEVL